MPSTTPFAPAQHIASFALAALLTTGLLLSLGAQADSQHAQALQLAQAAAVQQHCALPAAARRS